MTVTDATRGRFDIGRVIGRASFLITRNIMPFSILSLIFAGLPYLLMLLVIPSVMVTAGPGSPTTIVALLAVVFVYFIAALVLQAALTRASVDDLSGKPVEVAVAVQSGVSVLLPLLGLGLVFVGVALVGVLIFAAATAVGAMTLTFWPVATVTIGLIVVGIFVLLRWLVSGPVLVVERLGVFASLRRSSLLTENHRWAILAVLLIYGLVLFAVQMIIGFVVPGADATASGVAPEFSPVALVVLVALQVVNSVIGTVLIASIYFELRQLKDGIGAAELAEVFA